MNKELHRRQNEKNDLQLKYNELDQENDTLGWRASELEGQVKALRDANGPLPLAMKTLNDPDDPTLKPHEKHRGKARGMGALFFQEPRSDFYK